MTIISSWIVFLAFSIDVIEIGSDGYGNQLILIHNGNGNLNEALYLWNHELRQVEKIAESI